MGIVFSSLQVVPGLITLAGKSIPFWGFSYAYHPRPRPQLPGPIIQATAGDYIRMALVVRPNAPFGEDLSIIFPGQEGVEVRSIPRFPFRPVQPQYADGKMVSLTDYLAAGEIGAIEYRFRAVRSGIYLYESGTNSAEQVQMGLYGAIVVRPVGYGQPWHPDFRTAYGRDTASRHDIEKILVLGEIDSAMHNSVVSRADYNLRDFRPDCWVINGRSFPHSIAPDDDSSQPYGSAITCRVGQRVLLRILNAGFQAHTLAFGALTGRVIAEDDYPLKLGTSDATYEKTAVTVGPGRSVDLLVTPPHPGEFYVYDREYRHLVSDDRFPGGMMTKITVTP
ncbi:MAG: hypothetical protein PWR31_1928 [Bacillota bacterium]|nr:hypothetical protein [Bacillota bacterium]